MREKTAEEKRKQKKLDMLISSDYFRNKITQKIKELEKTLE